MLFIYLSASIENELIFMTGSEGLRIDQIKSSSQESTEIQQRALDCLWVGMRAKAVTSKFKGLDVHSVRYLV